MKISTLMLGLALAVGGSGFSAAFAETVTLRIGFAEISPGNRPFTNSGAISMAHSRGFIDDEFKDNPDVKLEYSFYQNGAAINEAVAAGQIDVALQGDLPWIAGVANGLDIKVIAGSDTRQNTYLAVSPTSTATGIDDIAGLRTAVFKGTNMHLAVARLLNAHGLSERDAGLINMDWDTGKAAIAAGDIDAVFGQPEYLEMQRKGLVKIIWDSKQEPNFTRSAHVIVTGSFEEAHPDIVQKFVDSLAKGAHWASQEENRQTVMETLALTGRPIEGYINDFENQKLEFRFSPLLDNWLIQRYQETADQAKEMGLIRREVKVIDHFEPKYIEAAIAKFGWTDFWTSYDAEGNPVVK